MADRWILKFQNFISKGDTSPSFQSSTSLVKHDSIDDRWTAKRVNDSYRDMAQLEICGDVDMFLHKILRFLQRIHPNKCSDVTMYDFIYTKCSETVQDFINANLNVPFGNTEALLKFLVNSVGTPFNALEHLYHLHNLKSKMKWKDIILFTEHYFNRWFNQVSASPDIVSRQLIYKKEILSMCGFETQRRLRDMGLLRPTELSYEAFCNALRDADGDGNLVPRYHHLTSRQLASTDQALVDPVSVEFLVKKSGSTVVPLTKSKNRRRTFKCSVCRSDSHRFVLCPRIRWEVRLQTLKPPKSRINSKNFANQRCSKCFEFGHSAKYCPRFAWIVYKSK